LGDITLSTRRRDLHYFRNAPKADMGCQRD
jgi:hypothetical protein